LQENKILCKIEAHYNYQTALLLSNTLKDEGGFKL
jgi:hypothetical protein